MLRVHRSAGSCATPTERLCLSHFLLSRRAKRPGDAKSASFPVTAQILNRCTAYTFRTRSLFSLCEWTHALVSYSVLRMVGQSAHGGPSICSVLETGVDSCIERLLRLLSLLVFHLHRPPSPLFVALEPLAWSRGGGSGVPCPVAFKKRSWYGIGHSRLDPITFHQCMEEERGKRSEHRQTKTALPARRADNGWMLEPNISAPRRSCWVGMPPPLPFPSIQMNLGQRSDEMRKLPAWLSRIPPSYKSYRRC